jgi:hypothetical protein
VPPGALFLKGYVMQPDSFSFRKHDTENDAPGMDIPGDRLEWMSQANGNTLYAESPPKKIRSVVWN